MISRARFSFSPLPANFPGAASGPIEFWLSRKRIIAGCDSAATAGSRTCRARGDGSPRARRARLHAPQLAALGDGDGEMVRPEGDQPLDEARARLELVDEPRLGFGEKLRLLDRLRLRRPGRCGLGSARFDHRRRRGRRHGRSGRARGRRRTRRRAADGPFRTGGRRRGQRRRLHRSRGHLRALFANALLLEVVGLESLGSRGRSVVADQRDIGRPQFFQEKAARIAGRFAQTARPRAEAEPVERRHGGGVIGSDRHRKRTPVKEAPAFFRPRLQHE